MAESPEKRPTAEEFTTDPKHKDAKDALWSYFDAYIKQRTEEAKARKKQTAGALDFIFDPSKIFSE